MGDIASSTEVFMFDNDSGCFLQPESTTYNRSTQLLFAVSFTTVFCKIANMKLIHIGQNIREARLSQDISQSELARALGIEPQAVQKWEAEKSAPRQERLSDIAMALKTTVRVLIRQTKYEISDLDGKAAVSGSKVSPRSRESARAAHALRGLVPLISWEQAATLGANLEMLKPEDTLDYMECPFDRGPNAFILEIAGEGNFDPTGGKSYAPGDFIAVDPAREPANRSMVVIQIEGEPRAALRQLLQDESGVRMLKALNPTWPDRIISFPDGYNIIGVVIGKWVPE
jgi:SOS-response transcriptional repressor LexA